MLREKIKNMKLKNRLTLFVLLAVAVVMAVSGLLRLNATGDEIHADMDDRMSLATGLAAESLIDPLLTADRNDINAIGNALFKDKHIGSILITDTTGAVIFDRQVEAPEYKPGKLITAEQSIEKDGLVIGKVTIGFTNYYNERAIRDEAVGIFAGILITCASLWLIISLISRMVTRPIYELIQGTDEIASGRYDKRLGTEYDDEIGRLARRYNNMAENIELLLRDKQEQYDELISAHEELVASEEELRSNYAELRNERAFSSAVLESVPGLLYLYDAEGRLIRWNKNHETATGYSAQELSKITLMDWYKHDKETAEKISCEVARAFGEGTAYAEAELPNKDGSRTPYYFTAVKTEIDNNPYIVGIGIDITQRKIMEAELIAKEKELSMSLFELTATAEQQRILYDEVLSANEQLEYSRRTVEEIFNAAGDGFMVCDGDTGEILSINRKMTEMFGYTEKEFKEQGVVLVSTPAFKEHALATLRKVIAEGSQSLVEGETMDSRGNSLTVEVKAGRVVIDGKVRCLVQIRDITDRKKLESAMEYLRVKDPLTGVYNRAYLETDMLRMQSSGYNSIGIFVCDVDGLKLINNTLGHRQGDSLLKKVAALLDLGVKMPNYVARVGGDEFAVVILDPSRSYMEELSQSYHRAVEKHNKDNPHLPLSLSLGWAMDTGAFDPERIFKEADNNMYRQKMHQHQSVRSSIVHTMMKALEARDHITEGHADRMGDLMEKMGRLLQLPQGTMADIKLFAKFHDIGKVGIPDSILNKPDKLTADEMAIMQQHCEIGFRIAKSSPDLEPIADWILKHQEYWNGGGYPLGIAKDVIPIECRILGIVDAFDAMTSDRPYRKAMPPSEALEEIRRCAGTQFDPDLVKIFVALVESGYN